MKAKLFVGPKNTGKTRVAKMIAEFIGKNNSAYYFDSDHVIRDPYAFSTLNSNTQLIIFDNLPLEFELEFFFPCEDNRITGGDITFSIRKHEYGHQPEIIQVPYLIFITNYLNPKWNQQPIKCSFYSRFDIIQFPLSYSDVNWCDLNRFSK